MSAPAPTRSRSAELLDTVLDAGTFRSWDLPAAPATAPGPAYRRELAEAAARAGTDEAVVSGEGRVGGRRLAVVCSEFRFLGGSIGTGTADRVAATVARATAERLPLLLAPASGGTRMQEGTPAFLRMIGIADRVAEHRRAGLPVVVLLRHPTTGGVLASWGSLGSITLAEPGALVGFLGPKVHRALHGTDFPPDVQTAENLHARGVLDAVTTPEQARELLRRVLALTSPGPVAAPTGTGPTDETGPAGDTDVWASVTATQRADRPGVLDLLERHADDVVTLHGTGEGETAAATVLCLARLAGTACVLVGQDRVAQRTRAVGPADLRVARRGMALARELRLPLVTVVDTPGAELSAAAESAGLAGAIARCLADLTALPVPTVAVILGEGAGGAALALVAADRVVVARHGWLTALPPEGASAIVHGRPDRAAETVAGQRVRSVDLLADGAVDRVVDERPDAADEPEAFLARVAAAVAEEVAAAAAGHGTRPRSGRPPTGSS
ncbi:carboxyl transferase domain-containing protein [Rhodococcus aerolatus]